MPGEGCLHRHFSGFTVANLAHHDDIRVLPQQGFDAGGEIQVDIVLYLHLVETGLDQFDRILDGAHVHFRRGEMLEAGIKRCGFTRTRRAGNQDDAVRPRNHVVPGFGLFLFQAQRGEIFHQHFRIENPQYQLFTEGGGHAR